MDDVQSIVDIFNPDNTSRPDLVPLSISFSPENPSIGQTVSVSVEIKNKGKRRAKATTVSLTVGGSEASRMDVPSLDGGEIVALIFPHKLALSSGLNVVKLLVDPSGELTEAKWGRQGNNALASTIVVGEPSMARHFSWSYKGTSWKLDFRLPSRDLEGLETNRDIYSYDKYLEYVKPEDRTIGALAQILEFYSQTAEFGSYDKVNFVLAFVQEMPYTSDIETRGDNYPKYPIETLVDGGGDCEDTSALFASIMTNREYFFGASLIIIDDHMGVGVVGEEGVGGVYFEKGTKRYYYCETTGRGYIMGDLPDAYVGEEIKDLIEIP